MPTVSKTTDFETARKGPLKFGYARVSTDDQSLNHQLDALRAAGCDDVFVDKMSGKTCTRSGLDRMLAHAREGDQIVVWKLSRLGRNFYHLVEVARELHAIGATFVSLTEGFDTATPLGEAVYRILCIFADLERTNIVENTVSGLAAAKARGVKLGRRPKLSEADAIKARIEIRNGSAVSNIAKKYGVSRATLFRYINGYR